MREDVRQNWPKVVSEELKEKLVKIFVSTQPSPLSTFTCAVYAEETARERVNVSGTA